MVMNLLVYVERDVTSLWHTTKVTDIMPEPFCRYILRPWPIEWIIWIISSVSDSFILGLTLFHSEYKNYTHIEEEILYASIFPICKNQNF